MTGPGRAATGRMSGRGSSGRSVAVAAGARGVRGGASRGRTGPAGGAAGGRGGTAEGKRTRAACSGAPQSCASSRWVERPAGLHPPDALLNVLRGGLECPSAAALAVFGHLPHMRGRGRAGPADIPSRCAHCSRYNHAVRAVPAVQEEEEQPDKEVEPEFGLSGALAAEANKVK